MNSTPPPLSLRERVTIEPMRPNDLDQVLAIEDSSFQRPWSQDQFETELDRRQAVCLAAQDKGRVLGYLVFWLVPPKIHVLNIAVRPEPRRQGLGGLLLDYMFILGRETGVREILLEVRASNEPAIDFYRSAGFVPAGRREDYYPDNNEDALVMVKHI